MFGMSELKETIQITDETIECPVKNCNTIVKRISKAGLKALDSYCEKGGIGDSLTMFKDHFCEKHEIFITPSTFIYKDYMKNCLWEEDTNLLKKMIATKRVKAQLYHDNSEDAATWNVFRFLEKNNVMDGFLATATGQQVRSSEVIYWSYSQEEGKAWTMLNTAREDFGERARRGSKPDLIIKTDKTLFFIEVKLGASNETTPSNKDNPKKYETGGNDWFSKVFRSDYKTIAITEEKYEMMRFWLLGTWIAGQKGLDYCLINLVLSDKEDDIEEKFKKHVDENEHRRFIRATWEGLYTYITESTATEGKEAILRYFRNKTLGYKMGKIQKAFAIS